MEGYLVGLLLELGPMLGVLDGSRGGLELGLSEGLKESLKIGDVEGASDGFPLKDGCIVGFFEGLLLVDGLFEG
jgi:hypothetical protein